MVPDGFSDKTLRQYIYILLPVLMSKAKFNLPFENQRVIQINIDIFLKFEDPLATENGRV